MTKTKLELFPYCDGCPEISPKVETLQTASVLDEEVRVRISCKNATKCENMRKHILSAMEVDENATVKE